jgi:hypothetical protein
MLLPLIPRVRHVGRPRGTLIPLLAIGSPKRADRWGTIPSPAGPGDAGPWDIGESVRAASSRVSLCGTPLLHDSQIAEPFACVSLVALQKRQGTAGPKCGSAVRSSAVRNTGQTVWIGPKPGYHGPVADACNSRWRSGWRVARRRRHGYGSSARRDAFSNKHGWMTPGSLPGWVRCLPRSNPYHLGPHDNLGDQQILRLPRCPRPITGELPLGTMKQPSRATLRLPYGQVQFVCESCRRGAANW